MGEVGGGESRVGKHLTTSMELYISTALLEHSGFKIFFFENPTGKLPPSKEALLSPNWRELELWQHFVPLFLNQRAVVPHTQVSSHFQPKVCSKRPALSRWKPSPAGAGTNSTTNSPCLQFLNFKSAPFTCHISLSSPRQTEKFSQPNIVLRLRFS